MRCVDDNVIGHAFEFGSFNGHLSIVTAVDHHAVDPVDAAITRDDADAKLCRAQSVWGGVSSRAKFASRRSVNNLEYPERPKCVHNFTALVWRPKHHNPS